MNMNTELSNLEYKSVRFPTRINLTVIGIFIFTFCFSTLKSFLFSSHLEILSISLLSISLIFLILNRFILANRSIILSSIDIMWILFFSMLFLNITWNSSLNKSSIYDLFVYASCILFLIIVKVDIRYYNSSLKLIKILSIIYACSAIFQFVFTDLYLNYVFPLFSMWEQENILNLLARNSYAGFTNQTAHLGGYIISGVGVIIFSNWRKKISLKLISALFLIILFIGLLLTTKRAHLIFAILAILITFLFSLNNKVFIKNVMKLFISLLVILFIAFFLFTTIEPDQDSMIYGFINELDETISGILEGEDITSGRSTLYSYAWSLFEENPIIGIGWTEFINESYGLINSDRGSHPHNIYIQLLTELGIVGFLLFMIPVTYIYYKTYRMLRVLSNKDSSFSNWKYGVQFSFFTQTFFLLYGMTGNLLTDYNFLLMYFFACSISLSSLRMLKTDQLI